MSLCSVSVEGSRVECGAMEEKGEGGEMYWCKTHPPAEKLKRQPSRVGLEEREREKGGGGSAQ